MRSFLYSTGPRRSALGWDASAASWAACLIVASSGRLPFSAASARLALIGVRPTLVRPIPTCEQVGIGLTNVGLTPIKASRAAAALKGKRPDEATIKQAAQLAADASQPSADLRGPVEYKKDLIRVLTARALRKALERAGGGR